MSMETRTVVRKLLRAMADDEMATLVTAQQEILSRRKRLELEWATVKKRYSAAIEEANEELAKNFEALRNGCVEDDVTCRASIDFAMGTLTVVRLDCEEVVEQRALLEHERQGVLFNDGGDDLLARVDAHLAACDEERAKSIERIPMPGPADVEEQAAEARGEVRVAEWPGEIAPGEASSDPKYWEAKKLEALGGIDPAAAVRDFGYGKRWCVKAEMSVSLQVDRGMEPNLAAYHMGAHAKAAKMKLHQNPFLNTNSDEAGRFDAWACGWNAVAALDTRIASASLNAAEVKSGVVSQAEEAEAASAAPAEHDERVGTEFAGDARVNHNGVFDPLCVSVHLPALTFKRFKARLEPVEVSPGRWTYGYDITHAEGGVSGPATIHGPWFEDMAAVVKDFGERVERSTPRLIANNDAFQKVLREWVVATLEACAGKAVAA